MSDFGPFVCQLTKKRHFFPSPSSELHFVTLLASSFGQNIQADFVTSTIHVGTTNNNKTNSSTNTNNTTIQLEEALTTAHWGYICRCALAGWTPMLVRGGDVCRALAERTPTATRAGDYRRITCGGGPDGLALVTRPSARSRVGGRRCSRARGTSVGRLRTEDDHQRSLGGVLGEVDAPANASVREITSRGRP